LEIITKIIAIMKKALLKTLPLLCAGLLLASGVFAQEEAEDIPLDFPAAWAGKWAGRLEIFAPDGKVRDLPMELLIQDVDSAYTWTIIYGQGEDADRREYLLRAYKPKFGLYRIDELNSIVLDATYIAGKLYSRFEVGNALLLSTTALVGDELHYEIISGENKPRTITGGGEHEGETIPEVKSLPVVMRQYAILRRR
jgi:hypothetical protein